MFESFLSARQYRILLEKKPPKALEGEVSQEVFDKSQVGHDNSELDTLQLNSRHVGLWSRKSKIWLLGQSV